MKPKGNDAFRTGLSPRGALVRGFFLLLLATFGCAAAELRTAGVPSSEESVILEGVPFFPQEEYQCGPAALAGVLNFYGDPVLPEQITEAIYRDSIRGTVSLDLALYPRKRGFKTHWFKGSTDEIRKALNRGVPLIVMVDKGIGWLKAYHYMVVTGYSAKNVIVNSGNMRGKTVSWSVFLHQWEKTQNWTLSIMPDPQSHKISEDR